MRDLSKPQEDVVYHVSSAERGMRLDLWLSQHVTWRSRTDLQRRIRNGRVLLNGETVRKAVRVQGGQEVRIFIDAARQEAESDILDPESLSILYEDEWMVVLNKAPGSVVHPVGQYVSNTIINALHLRHKTGTVAGDPPMIVHRLDKDTSGVLVLAKDMEVRKALGQAFESRKVSKSYLAIVSGPLLHDTGVLDEPIGIDEESDNRTRVCCRPDGKPSRTEYTCVSRTELLSLVRCQPLTGRQHQIRIHLHSIGHPILCDRLYGSCDILRAQHLSDAAMEPGFGDDVLLSRQALHAERLSFVHPKTNEEMHFHAPLAPDLLWLAQRAGLRMESTGD